MIEYQLLNKIADNSSGSKKLLRQTPGLQQGELYRTVIADYAFFTDTVQRAGFGGGRSCTDSWKNFLLDLHPLTEPLLNLPSGAH